MTMIERVARDVVAINRRVSEIEAANKAKEIQDSMKLYYKTLYAMMKDEK